MSSTKPTRNTDLVKALAPDLSDYSSARTFWHDYYARAPSFRATHVADAIRRQSPLRTRGGSGHAGWGSFQVTADNRSYTVVVLADAADEWALHGSLPFREFVAGHIGPIERTLIIRQLEQERIAKMSEGAQAR
jgi:hypothetical protein